MKSLFNLFFLLAILLLASCSAPRRVVKLQPQAEKIDWLYGHEYSSDSVFGIIAKASFDEINDPWYIFDVEITNRSNMPFLVDPTSMFCVPLDGNLAPLNGDTLYAIDPELKIKELNHDIARNNTRKKNQLGLTLLAAGIDIFSGIIVSTDHNPRNDNFRTNLLPAAIAQGQENHFEAIDLKELRDTWESTTIRRTNLESGYVTHGKILVPMVPNAAYIQLNIPVDNDIIRINYQQVRSILKR